MCVCQTYKNIYYKIGFRTRFIIKFIVLREIIGHLCKYHELDLSFSGNISWKDIFYQIRNVVCQTYEKNNIYISVFNEIEKFSA